MLPIPAKKVVEVLENNRCLDIQCNDLPTVMQAVVDQLCNLEVPTLDFGCLEPVATVPELYQLLLTTACQTTVTPVQTEPTYQYCSTDGWSCGDTACLEPSNPCNPISQADVIQALINRSNGYANVINTLCTRVTALEATVISLQNQLNSLKECC